MSDNNAAISVTLKASQGYDAPWVVVYGDSPQQVSERLDGVAQAGLLAKAAESAVELQGIYAAAKGLGAKPQAVEGTQQQTTWTAPQSAAPSQSGPPVPQCQHGPRVWKTGTSKAGKAYAGWMCPAPRNSACPPEWA